MWCLSLSGLRWANKTGIFILGTLTIMTVGFYIKTKKNKKQNRGEPQGFILGLILFLFYINDLEKCTDLFTLLFSDYSIFLISGKNFTELKQKLNIEIKKVTDWFRCNEMSLNHEKTKIMVFNKKRKHN